MYQGKCWFVYQRVNILCNLCYFFLQKNQTPSNYLVLQVLSGDQGFQWNRMNVTLSSTSDFEVSIRGYKGKGYHGDIAIDDIIVYDGKCQN